MLILRRKAGESIVIGDEIKVTVIDINEGSIRLAVDAPKRIPVLRSELLQAADINRNAAKQAAVPQALLPLLRQGSGQGIREKAAADAHTPDVPDAHTADAADAHTSDVPDTHTAPDASAADAPDAHMPDAS